jgi:hypothetical protein
MAKNYSPVPPFNASVKYFDEKTPSGLTTAGYQQFAQLQAAQGVAPVVSEAPTGAAATGAFVFNPATNTLHVYNGTSWVATVLS